MCNNKHEKISYASIVHWISFLIRDEIMGLKEYRIKNVHICLMLSVLLVTGCNPDFFKSYHYPGFDNLCYDNHESNLNDLLHKNITFMQSTDRSSFVIDTFNIDTVKNNQVNNLTNNHSVSINQHPIFLRFRDDLERYSNSNSNNLPENSRFANYRIDDFGRHIESTRNIDLGIFHSCFTDRNDQQRNVPSIGTIDPENSSSSFTESDDTLSSLDSIRYLFSDSNSYTESDDHQGNVPSIGTIDPENSSSSFTESNDHQGNVPSIGTIDSENSSSSFTESDDTLSYLDSIRYLFSDSNSYTESDDHQGNVPSIGTIDPENSQSTVSNTNNVSYYSRFANFRLDDFIRYFESIGTIDQDFFSSSFTESDDSLNYLDSIRYLFTDLSNFSGSNLINEDLILTNELAPFIDRIKELTDHFQNQDDLNDLSFDELKRIIHDHDFNEIGYHQRDVLNIQKIVKAAVVRGADAKQVASTIINMIFLKRLYLIACSNYMSNLYMKLQYAEDPNNSRRMRDFKEYISIGIHLRRAIKRLSRQLESEAATFRFFLERKYGYTICGINRLLTLSKDEFERINYNEYILNLRPSSLDESMWRQQIILDSSSSSILTEDSMLTSYINPYINQIKELTANMKRKVCEDGLSVDEVKSKLSDTDYKEILYNKQTIHRLLHIMMAAYIKGADIKFVASTFLDIIAKKRLYALAYNNYMAELYLELDYSEDSDKGVSSDEYNTIGKKIKDRINSLKFNLMHEGIQYSEVIERLYNYSFKDIDQLLALSEDQIDCINYNAYITMESRARYLRRFN